MRPELTQLRDFLANHYPGLDIVVLIGSRARGDHRPDSDWDFAIQWPRNGEAAWQRLSRTEALRQALAEFLGTSAGQVDLVEIPEARLAIRAVIAEEGIPLKGESELPWLHFLSRTWRELEDYYWDDLYAA